MCAPSLFDDFIFLIYPKICLGCETPLLKHEQCICSICQFHIPKTNHFKEKENSLQITIDTESQTKKNKYSRWENVGNVFEITNSDKLKHKHILLIDNVGTTGSTLESCVIALQQMEGIKVSIITIAIA